MSEIVKIEKRKLSSQEEYEQREPYEVTCDICETKYKTKIEPNWYCGSTNGEKCKCKLNYTNFYCPVCSMLEEDVIYMILKMEEKDIELKKSNEDLENYRTLVETLSKKVLKERLEFWNMKYIIINK